MKRKVILALLATMTLTVGSLGTAFAMNSNPGIVIQTSESSVPTDPTTPENPGTGEETPEEPEVHTHVWGDAYYVKDADAVYSEPEWIVDKEAVYEDQKVIDQPEIKEDITEYHNFCKKCNMDLTAAGMDNDAMWDHIFECGSAGYYGEYVKVGEKVVQEEISHIEHVMVSPEEGHWTEAQLISPEKGHWEHKCADCGITENCSAPGTVIPDDPDTDGNTDKPGDTTENTGGNTQTSGDNTGNTDENTQKPGTSAGDNTQTSTENNSQTSTGNNSQTTTDDKTQSGNENTSNTENTENKSEDQKQNENKTTTTADSKDQRQDDTTVTASAEKKAPKTGDTASLIYLATLAGSAVTGGTAFGLRRKFKK